MALGLFPGDAEMIAQQRRPATKSTMASVLDAQLTALESQFVPAAEAMPADKYSFAPTMGGYNGVRTFALEMCIRDRCDTLLTARDRAAIHIF